MANKSKREEKEKLLNRDLSKTNRHDRAYLTEEERRLKIKQILFLATGVYLK